MSSNWVCNHTYDKQIGLPLRGRPILLSLVWLQNELDSTSLLSLITITNNTNTNTNTNTYANTNTNTNTYANTNANANANSNANANAIVSPGL